MLISEVTQFKADKLTKYALTLFKLAELINAPNKFKNH
jgi:hypothetical protein